MTKKYEIKDWLYIVIAFGIIGIVIIGYLKFFTWSEKVSNIIAYLGILFGALITLISILITNNQNHDEKMKLDIKNKKDNIEFKRNALKYLKKELEENLSKYNKMESREKNYCEQSYQTLIWETYRSLFVEIFIEVYNEKLSKISDLYTYIKANGYTVNFKNKNEIGNLLNHIKIDDVITAYDEKLNSFIDTYSNYLS